MSHRGYGNGMTGLLELAAAARALSVVGMGGRPKMLVLAGGTAAGGTATLLLNR